MTKEITVLPEPGLEFRYGQVLEDPRDGLTLFGPYDADLPSHPANIRYAVVGTGSGVRSFQRWAETLNSPLYPGPGMKPRLWPVFPGFEVAFRSKWPQTATRTGELDETTLLELARDADASKRASSVVELYLGAIEKMQKGDDVLSVVICVVPDAVWVNCRPKSRVISPSGTRVSSHELGLRRQGQAGLFDTYDPSIYKYSVDFRRQLKARVMTYGVPIQIVRESTLRLEDEARPGHRHLTPLSDRAWNLGVALYYKSGGKPWKLPAPREGVSYIGLAYRRENPNSPSNRTACCAAQMFLDSGDGIVFLGEFGPWYSPDRHDFHLPKKAARDLLEGVLKTHREQDGRPLRELFIHCRSSIYREEFEGFQEAAPSGVRVVGVRVRPEYGVKMFREGKMPVIRGSTWRIDERSALLWASGFKPRLRTYDGSETPVPLKIDVQRGDQVDISVVVSDILALTKLNYNACRLGESQPVTVGFSDAVGEILISNPTVETRRPNFKFYI